MYWIIGYSLSPGYNVQSSTGSKAASSGTKAAQVVRLVRMVRLVRLVKLYKYLQKAMSKEVDTDEMPESRVGAAMTDVTNKRFD
jgi:hypothetical protein